MSKKKRLRNQKLKQLEKQNEQPSQKKDRSPLVVQRGKIETPLTIFQRELTEKQKLFIELALDKKVKMLLVSGPAGTTKAQPLDSEVMTPSGPIMMGELLVGDDVLGEDGKAHKVTEIHPQGSVDVVKVHFSDGTSTRCCWDHLWLTQTDADRNHRKKTNGTRISEPMPGTVKSTREIYKSLLDSRGRTNHSIPITQPVEFNERTHLISPYVMGALLGDGCFRARGNIRFSNSDEEIINRVKNEITDESECVFLSGCDYSIRKKNPGAGRTIEKLEVARLGLDLLYSHEKFIPKEYMIDSVENRIKLLRGIMDTDGTVARGVEVSFSSTSERLISDVVWIVQSLGGTCSRHTPYTAKYKKKEKYVECKMTHKISIKLPPTVNPFYLPRKRNAVVPKSKYVPVRYIKKIEPVGKTECQCIKVDSPSHLYLTNDFIVTHNTYLAVLASLLLMNEKKISDILYVRSVVESADVKMGTLPGEADDKLSPYKRPLIDKLDELLPKEHIQYLLKDNRIEGLPVGYLRGMNWNAKAVIGDEMQNLTKKELITLMTRAGEFSKLFLCGDPQQSDINGRSGFQSIFNLFNDAESKDNGIYTFQFTEDDILRSALVKYIVTRVKSLG